LKPAGKSPRLHEKRADKSENQEVILGKKGNQQMSVLRGMRNKRDMGNNLKANESKRRGDSYLKPSDWLVEEGHVLTQTAGLNGSANQARQLWKTSQ
jgi:hypothetical protein